jgi:uncharacterized membrane protein YhaH (DUF805 family)
MSFGEAIQTVVRKYAEFEGRAGRAEFWWWTLFYVLVASALGLFSVVPFGEGANLGWLLTSLWGLAALLPNLAVAVRRLRDAGYGWGNMFWILVPIGGLIILIVYWTRPSAANTPAPSTDAATTAS